MKKQVKISEVKGNPNNPRLIKDEKYQILLNSIKSFPQMLEKRPIIVDENMIVLGGNMRLKACKEAGLKKVWVDDLEDNEWTDDQKREFIVKDNIGYGEWDWQMLNDWDQDELEEWGMDLPEDFNVITDAEEDDFIVPDPDTVETDIVRGDIFEIGEHRLLCGDSCDSDDVTKLMNGEKARMVFTDPPWNVNYGDVKEGNEMGYKPRTILNDHMDTEDFKDFMGDAFSMMAMASEKGAATYVVMSAQEWGNMMLALHENGYHWSSTIIWNKSHLVMSRKDYHTKYEPIWYGWLEGAPRLCPLKDRKQSDVWDVDRPTKSELHPTTKPIELLNIAVNNSSKRKDLILDLFLGSGSTMVASHQLERKCYGMELDPKYCQVIVNRMKSLDPDIKIKRNGKEID